MLRLELPIGLDAVMQTAFPPEWQPEAFDEVDGKQVAKNPWDQVLYDGTDSIRSVFRPGGQPVVMRLDTALVARFGTPFFKVDSLMWPSSYYNYGGKTFVIYLESGQYRDSVCHEMVAYLDYAYLLGFEGDRCIDRALIHFEERKMYQGLECYFYLDERNNLYTREFDNGEIGNFVGQHFKRWDKKIGRWIEATWREP